MPSVTEELYTFWKTVNGYINIFRGRDRQKDIRNLLQETSLYGFGGWPRK